MPDSSGLNQQQAIAAKIPFENIGLRNPAETFLSAYMLATQINAKKQQMQNAIAKLGLENEALNIKSNQNQNIYQLRLQQMQNADQASDTAHQIQLQRANNESDHWRNMRDIGMENNRVKDERTKLYSEKVAATLADQTEKAAKQRLLNFNAEAGNVPGGLGLPADAFENPDILKGDTNAPGWHVDPNKPDYRYYNKPLSDNAGQPIMDSSGKQRLHPITVHNNTFNRLKNTYDDLRSGGPTSRQVPAADETVPTTKPLDATTAKGFLQQAGGDKVKARQMAQDAGYTF